MIDGGLSVKHEIEQIDVFEDEYVNLSPSELKTLNELTQISGSGVSWCASVEFGSGPILMIRVHIPVPEITLLEGPTHASEHVQEPREPELHRPSVSRFEVFF